MNKQKNWAFFYGNVEQVGNILVVKLVLGEEIVTIGFMLLCRIRSRVVSEGRWE